MDEGGKRVLAIVARILVARHLKTPEDLGPRTGLLSPRPSFPVPGELPNTPSMLLMIAVKVSLSREVLVMKGSYEDGASQVGRCLNAVALQNAVLCAECDVVSDSPARSMSGLREPLTVQHIPSAGRHSSRGPRNLAQTRDPRAGAAGTCAELCKGAQSSEKSLGLVDLGAQRHTGIQLESSLPGSE
jgi:hypothetical protein